MFGRFAAYLSASMARLSDAAQMSRGEEHSAAGTPRSSLQRVSITEDCWTPAEHAAFVRVYTDAAVMVGEKGHSALVDVLCRRFPLRSRADISQHAELHEEKRKSQRRRKYDLFLTLFFGPLFYLKNKMSYFCTILTVFL